MKCSLLSICLFIGINGNAQSIYPDTVANHTIYMYVEQMPKCEYNLNEYIRSHIHYPAIARAHGIEGQVSVSFIVNENGQISDCIVVKGISNECDAEALRVVKEMPLWKPGKQDGKAVKVRYYLPVVFKISN